MIEELGRFFRPELINRLDNVIRFSGLDQDQIHQIVRLELAKVNRVLAEQELVLEATEEAVAHLARIGWDPRFGARPVKRVIQREVQDRLADSILAGTLMAGQTVLLDSQDGEFTMTNQRVVDHAMA